MVMITQKALKELFHYDESTGMFIDKNTSCCAGRSLRSDPSRTKLEYISISIKGRTYLAHRLAWLYVYGDMPKGHIDHINGEGTDNRLQNLRDVTRSQNQKNRKLNKNNKFGIPGISVRKDTGQYNVQINSEGKRYFLGTYRDLFEAFCARKSAEVKFGFLYYSSGRVV